MALWKCKECGYSKESRCKPKKCPECQKKDVFVKVEGGKTKKC